MKKRRHNEKVKPKRWRKHSDGLYLKILAPYWFLRVMWTNDSFWSWSIVHGKPGRSGGSIVGHNLLTLEQRYGANGELLMDKQDCKKEVDRYARDYFQHLSEVV